MTLQKFLFSAVMTLSLFSAGCATRRIAQLNTSDSFEGKTVLLFSMKVTGNNTDVLNQGCKLILLDGREQALSLPIDPANPLALVPVTPGPYIPDQIYCSLSQRWQIPPEKTKSFMVRQGRINYVGQFLLDMNLGRVSAGYTKLTGADAVQLKQFYNQLSPSGQTLLISAWSQKQITDTMIEEPTNHFHLQWKAAPTLTAAPLIERMTSCLNAESARNPAHMGREAVRAKYLNSRFVEIKKEPSQSTSSPEYIQCVHQSLRAFSPNSSAPAEVTAKF